MSFSMEDARLQLAHELSNFALSPGRFQTAVKNVNISRAEAKTVVLQTMYSPSFSLIAQGEQTVRFAASNLKVTPSQFIHVSVPLPLEVSVTSASEDAPLIGLSVDLDQSVLSRLIIDIGDEDAPETFKNETRAVGTHEVTVGLMKSILRLVDLLKDKTQARLFSDDIVREIFYQLLLTSAGACLREYAMGSVSKSQIIRTVRYMDENFAEPMDVAMVADYAGMSESAFHAAFKNMTGMSPMKYVKMLRLHNARILILTKRLSVGEAAFRVGFSSHSQFSREFRRLFGKSPSKAIETLQPLG